MQASNIPTLPTVTYTFAPRPGGHLLCLWVPHGGPLRRIRAALLALPKAPTCGVIHRPDRDLVLIWPDSFLEAALVRQTLAGHSGLIEWDASIDCATNMQWEPWLGEPYEVPTEPIPDWLRQLQAVQTK